MSRRRPSAETGRALRLLPSRAPPLEGRTGSGLPGGGTRGSGRAQAPARRRRRGRQALPSGGRAAAAARAPQPWERTLEILGEVAAALERCHAVGVVHRDLKPANVLIEEGSQRAVLLDFGLAAAGPGCGQAVARRLRARDRGGAASGRARGAARHPAPRRGRGAPPGWRVTRLSRAGRSGC
ncbi:MAG TPA: hypothetical protein DEA08_27105 [Planctomycetes bacterium]|nr:hypothetical protein [Planctomycetota bacterium]